MSKQKSDDQAIFAKFLASHPHQTHKNPIEKILNIFSDFSLATRISSKEEKKLERYRSEFFLYKFFWVPSGISVFAFSEKTIPSEFSRENGEPIRDGFVPSLPKLRLRWVDVFIGVFPGRGFHAAGHEGDG